MTQSQDNSNENQEQSGGNREAAKYRRQLRDAQAERDSLQTTVDAHNRSSVERLASAHLAQPSDLFDLGSVDLSDLMDEDGQPDAEAVKEAAESILADRPGLAAVSALERLQREASEHLTDEGLADLAKSLEDFGSFIDPAAFTDDKGALDAEKLEAFITLARPRSWPDIGGGQRHHGIGKHKPGSAWQRLLSK